MVLTNFECWAHAGAGVDGGSVGAAGTELPFGAAVAARHMDPFNPRAVQQTTGISAAAPHISSNCYYGFSYVNAAHELNNNNNNNNVNAHNNNGCMPNANDVNGMAMMHDADDGAHANALAAGGAVARCKKRYFVSDDDYANCDIGVGVGVDVAGLNAVAAKRCRYDDDTAAAQYCNDFFSLPSTQIGTQSCLMDTEDYSQQQQPSQEPQQQQQQQQQQSQQVDVAMGAAFEQQSTITTSNIHFASHLQQTQQQSQQTAALAQTVATNNGSGTAPDTGTAQLPTVAYQQQHNYQANSSRSYAYRHNAKFALNRHNSNDYHHINPNEHNKSYCSSNNKAKVQNDSDKGSRQHEQSTHIAAEVEDEAVVAATLYAATHGGCVYQFAGINLATGYASNEHFIEDI